MRTLISLAHLSLDGFMSDPDGGMGFIKFDDELADYTYPLIGSVDTSVYGRITYQMMEGYWPSVVDDASIGVLAQKHARWYTNVEKIVASRTLTSNNPRTHVVGDDIVAAVRAAKAKPGGDMMIFASPTLTHTLAAAGLVDEYRLTIQPVCVGGGLPLFAPGAAQTQLSLRTHKTFSSGVIAAHYTVVR